MSDLLVTPLVEKVARALCAHDFSKRYGKEYTRAATEANWDLFKDKAQAAITAIESSHIREALEELEKAEARYRYAHDILGTGDPKTGRAWDLMKRAGDKARTALSHKETNR